MSSAAGFGAAILNSGTENVRVHRKGFRPAIGAAAASKVLSGLGQAKTWKTMGCGVAKSGDFGYTYGRYEVAAGEDKTRKGYWARVWKRDEGRWRLVVDVANEG